jgi:hypothetical protein
MTAEDRRSIATTIWSIILARAKRPAIAGDEEVMLEGAGQVDMQAEEVQDDVGADFSVGVVCATTTINHWKGRRERRWQSKR